MNLENSVASLLDQFPNGERLDLQREEKRLEKFGSVAFGGLMVVIGLAILWMIYSIFMKMIFRGTEPLEGIFMIAFIVFAALTLTYVVWRESLKEKRQKVETAPGKDALPPVETRSLEEGNFEPVPSVTEGTTELFEVRRKTRELDR